MIALIIHLIYRNLLEAEREDTNGEVDFLSIRVASSNEQPVKKSEPYPANINNRKTKVSNRHNRESLENMVDNCIDKLQKENNGLVENESTKKRQPRTWMDRKEPARKTYGRRERDGDLLESESSAYTGEELPTDEEFWRRGRLPLVTSDSREDKVNRWLVEVEPGSQPSPGQRKVSTPKVERALDKKHLGEKEVNLSGHLSDHLSDLSPFTQPLSPVDLNVLNGKAGDRRVSMEDTVLLSQEIPSSCPVEVNDTFDKFVLQGKVKALEQPLKSEHEIICAQTSSSGSMPPLISPSVAVNVLKTLETSTESDDRSDIEGETGRLEALKSVKTTKRKSNFGSHEFLEHEAENKSVVPNEITFAKEEIKDNNPALNSSTEECQGWTTQDAKEVESKADQYNHLLAEEEKQIAAPSAVEKTSTPVQGDDVEKKSVAKLKVPFSLAGRIAPKLKPRMEKVATFVQLGCLASPRRYQLPSLRSIVAKKREVMKQIEPKKVLSSIFDEESGKAYLSGCPPSNKSAAITTNLESDTRLQDQGPYNDNTGSSVLKAHIEKVSNKLAVADEAYTDVSRIEPTLPEGVIEWNINKTPPEDGIEPSFMQHILGNNDDLYSQDQETEAEKITRVARIEFEQEVEDLNRKRARSEDADECKVEEFTTPVKNKKKVARIESDSDDTLDSPIGKTPERARATSKFRSIVAARRSRLSASKTPCDQETVLQSRSQLGSPLIPRDGASVARSVSASGSEAGKVNTQDMVRQIEESELTAKRLREEAEMMASGDIQENNEDDRVSDVEPMLEDACTDILEKREEDRVSDVEPMLEEVCTDLLDQSENLLPVKIDFVPETETMAAVEPGVAETKFVLESDDDMFSQTPERPVTEIMTSQIPQLSPVQEEEDMVVEKKKGLVDASKWKFVVSGLSASNKKIAQQFIDDLDCQGISNSVDSSVTHVVVKTGEDLEAQRTLKFLQAVSSGIMIVSFLWVEACLKNKDNLSKADKWEVLDEELGGANGPFRARKGREEGRKPLLAGFEVLINGPLDGLDKPTIEDLLSRVGARTVPRVNMFSCAPGITRLVLVNSATNYGVKEVTKMLRSYRLAVVDKDWLLDTVSSHSVRPLLPYTINTVVNQVELMRAGYSGVLTEVD